MEPIQTAHCKVSIRSAYRSPEVNRIGNEKAYNCSSNEYKYARHIWDVPDETGNYGATACIVVNSFIDYYEETGDWPALAWWIHDHVPVYQEIMFYPKLAAFNINWYSGDISERTIAAQMPNPETGEKGILTRTGWKNFEGSHSESYASWLKKLS